MAQATDYTIDNSTGANVRSDINTVLEAIATNNSGSSAPSNTQPTQFFADTSAGILKLRNTANSGYVNLFTLAGGVDVDAASNFNEDVTFTTSNGNNVLFDKSDNALEFGDGVKALFGASSDLEIQHTGTHSVIKDAGTGNLQIAGSLVQITNAAITESGLIFTENGSVVLKFDNSTKIETAADRVNVTGHLFINGGNNLYIQNGFTNSNARIRNTGGSNDSNLEFLIRESGTELEALEITNTGHIRIPNDDKRLKLGSGDDIQIYHDGAESYIKNTNSNSNLILEGAHGVDIKHGGEDMGKFRPDDAVQLYFDNTLKFKTTGSGISVEGKIGVGGTASNRSINTIGAEGNAQTTLFYGFGTIDLTSASDERVKNNVVDTAKGLDDILKLRIVDFTYTPEYAEDSTTVRTGGIAQEWQKVDPNLVNTENEDLLFIEYKRVIPHLIKAVQQLSDKVAALEAA